MAKILNIETSTSVCSVALSDNGEVFAIEETHQANSHSEKLSLYIDDVINKSGIKLSQLDAIAVSCGPGSYTGLRIGVSAAKGLCFGLDIPLIAISSLKAMAWEAFHQTQRTDILYCPMIDARRQEVYTALYDSKGNELLPVHARILDKDAFHEFLEKYFIAFMGDGMPKMKVYNLNRGLWFDNIYASAKNMVSLAENSFLNKDFKDVSSFEPFYLKDFVAGRPLA